MEIRTEFGENRSICSCDECVTNCKFIPGCLIPSDLDRIEKHLGGRSLEAWAESALLASMGATVMVNGQIINIPTLVPNRKADGSCIFLSHDNRCQIWEISPFGCAFFGHQTDEEADRMMRKGLEAIARSFALDTKYAMLWKHLYELGKLAPSPTDSRRKMGQFLKREKLLQLTRT